MRFFMIAAGLTAASACVDPSARIAGELTRYGLDRPRAQCIGNRLETDLSIGQLKQLAAAARAYGRDDPDPGRLTLSDLVRVAGEMHDPKVPLAVGRAAVGCGISLTDVL